MAENRRPPVFTNPPLEGAEAPEPEAEEPEPETDPEEDEAE